MQLILPPYAEINGIAAPPHPKQAAFHALPNIYKMMRGGLGSGKSHAGARELMCGILENYQAMAARGGHGQMLALVGGPSYDILEVGAWFHICNWLDEFQRINGWKLDKRRLLSHPRKIELIGDLGVIKFISLDQPQKYAAATASAVWIDESELLSSSVEAWQMLQGRLRDNRAERRFMLATSSPRGSRGLAKLFEDKIANGDPSYGLVVSSSYDNPGNPKEYVDNMIACMSDYEKRMQIDAELLSDRNAIYGAEFCEVQSINSQWRYERGERYEYNLAIDWGTHYHCLFIQHDRDTGVDTVFDETIITGCMDEEFCQAVVRQLKTNWGLEPGDLTDVITDYNPRSANFVAYKYFKSQGRGKVRHRRVRDNQDRWAGINTVRWRLRDAKGVRRLMFAAHLRKNTNPRGVLRCFANYALSERSVQGERVVTDRPVPDSPYSHSCDALRYYLWIRESHRRWHDKKAVVASIAA